jgi:hypothetical protein
LGEPYDEEDLQDLDLADGEDAETVW